MAPLPGDPFDTTLAGLPEVLRKAQLRVAATAALGFALSLSVGVGVLCVRGAAELRLVLGASVCAGLVSMPLVAGFAIVDLVRHRRACTQTLRHAARPQTF